MGNLADEAYADADNISINNKGGMIPTALILGIYIKDRFWKWCKVSKVTKQALNFVP